MKVLHRNEKTVPEKWTGHYCCGGCESTLEVDELDLNRYHSFSPRGGASWDHAAFQCVVCEGWNTVDVPNKVLHRRPKTGAAPPTPAHIAKRVILRQSVDR